MKEREPTEYELKVLSHYEQVRWERDCAIEQLNSLGIGLGEKKTKADICREFAHNIKEKFNESVPLHIPSHKVYFNLEQARDIVDMALAEMRKE